MSVEDRIYTCHLVSNCKMRPFITLLASDVLLVLNIVNTHGILPRPCQRHLQNILLPRPNHWRSRLFSKLDPKTASTWHSWDHLAQVLCKENQSLLLIAVHARATGLRTVDIDIDSKSFTPNLTNADSRLAAAGSKQVWRSCSVFSRSVLEFHKGIRAAATFQFHPVRRVIMMLVLLVQACGAWRGARLILLWNQTTHLQQTTALTRPVWHQSMAKSLPGEVESTFFPFISWSRRPFGYLLFQRLLMQGSMARLDW